MTNHGSPTHKLIRVSVETAMKGPLYWKTLIKAHPNRTLNSVTVAADDKLLLQYIEDVKVKIVAAFRLHFDVIDVHTHILCFSVHHVRVRRTERV